MSSDDANYGLAPLVDRKRQWLAGKWLFQTEAISCSLFMLWRIKCFQLSRLFSFSSFSYTRRRRWMENGAYVHFSGVVMTSLPFCRQSGASSSLWIFRARGWLTTHTISPFSRYPQFLGEKQVCANAAGLLEAIYDNCIQIFPQFSIHKSFSQCK